MESAPKGAPPPRAERRAAPRVRLLTHAYFSAGHREGSGIAFDLSITGARIEEATVRPQTGEAIELVVALGDDDAPLEASGTVVRQTASGFAVQFREVDPRLKDWFERILSGPGAARPAPRRPPGGQGAGAAGRRL
jgi:hypothetical protein